MLPLPRRTHLHGEEGVKIAHVAGALKMKMIISQAVKK